MKKIFALTLLFLVGFVWAASAEDLGALAKKEKERREALAKSGKKVKTLTNEDIANLKSQVGYEKTTSEETTPEPPVAGQETPAEAESAPPAEGTADAELEKIKAEKQKAEEEGKEAVESIGRGGLFQTHDIGAQYRQKRQSEEKVQELDKKAEEVKKKQQEGEEESETAEPNE